MDKAGLLQLPGRPEEQDWLRERLEVLTAREGIALDAAIQRHPAQDSTEVVSLLASLDEYEVLGGIQSYEYRCPKCRQKLRVPRGRGRIQISCPRCGTQFIKKS